MKKSRTWCYLKISWHFGNNHFYMCLFKCYTLKFDLRSDKVSWILFFWLFNIVKVNCTYDQDCLPENLSSVHLRVLIHPVLIQRQQDSPMMTMVDEVDKHSWPIYPFLSEVQTWCLSNYQWPNHHLLDLIQGHVNTYQYVLIAMLVHY